MKEEIAQIEHRPKQKVVVSRGLRKIAVVEYYRLKIPTDEDFRYEIRGVMFEPSFTNNIESILSLFPHPGLPSEVERRIREYHTKIAEFLKNEEVAEPLFLEKPNEYFSFETSKEVYEII